MPLPRILALDSGPLRAGAKYRAADAHVCRTERDRGLEVVAHAHAQAFQAEIACEFGEEGEVHGALLIDGGYAHEPGNLELQLVVTEREEARQVAWKDACLLRLLAGIDLDKKVEATALLGDLGCDRTRDLGAIDRVYGVE